MCIIDCIENHPVTIGVITAVFSAFWIKRYIRQKRLDACFGYYANLALMLHDIEQKLMTMQLLAPECFNIFCLHFVENVRNSKYPDNNIDEVQYMELKEIAQRIHALLLNTDNNINPKNMTAANWYRSQWQIFDLCGLILGYSNLRIADATSTKPKELCEDTVLAIKGMVEAIQKEQEKKT